MDRVYATAIDIVYKEDNSLKHRQILHEILKTDPLLIVEADLKINRSAFELRVLDHAKRTGNKIQCIKLYRELTFSTLREAKETVEKICSKDLFEN